MSGEGERDTLGSIRALLADEDATINVVTLEGLEDPQDHSLTWTAGLLSLSDDLASSFRETLNPTLRGFGDLMVEGYEPGFVPGDGEIVEADVELIADSPLLKSVLAAAQARTRAHDRPNDEPAAEPPRNVKAYAVLVSSGE